MAGRALEPDRDQAGHRRWAGLLAFDLVRALHAEEMRPNGFGFTQLARPNQIVPSAPPITHRWRTYVAADHPKVSAHTFSLMAKCLSGTRRRLVACLRT